MGVIDMNKCIFFYTQDTLFEVIFLCKIKTGKKKKKIIFLNVFCVRMALMFTGLLSKTHSD